MSTTKLKGTVKWFDESKGFGFIHAEEGYDVFVHYTAIQATGYRTLKEGQAVTFEVADDTRGKKAANVERV